MEIPQTIPILTAQEQRVLGSLMEKSRATPEYYPMTVNSLIAACNQKTSRKPVVNYDEATVVLSLDSLRKKALVSTVTGGSSRAVKYKHNVAIAFPVIPAQVAIICLLLLRGPQTPGELHTHSGRLYEFESIDEVLTMLEQLCSTEPALVKQLPRRSGQKEQRFIHLLGEAIQDQEEEAIETSSNSTAMEARLLKVEAELEELKEAFQKLMKELLG